MLWSGNATIGFNTDGSFYQNHIFSGTSHAKDIACLNSPLSMWSNVLFQLGMLQFIINHIHKLNHLCLRTGQLLLAQMYMTT